jgi:hypothetical protein
MTVRVAEVLAFSAIRTNFLNTKDEILLLVMK